MNNDSKVYSVGELVSQIRLNLEKQHPFVIVEGEVTNYSKHQGSGHVYFALSEAGSLLQCISWKSVKIPTLKDGAKVCCTGKITAYAGRSQFQLNITSVSIQGQGNVFKMFEEMKAKLTAEGLFDQSRKRKITTIPRVIGIITAADGDALQDILARLKDRISCKIIVWPVAVQGSRAAETIVAAIDGFNNIPHDPLVRRTESNTSEGSEQDIGRVSADLSRISQAMAGQTYVNGQNATIADVQVSDGVSQAIAGQTDDQAIQAMTEYMSVQSDSINNLSVETADLGAQSTEAQISSQSTSIHHISQNATQTTDIYISSAESERQNHTDSLQSLKRPDVLIITRGGGSLEDLWAFNEESVVRAIASSQIPTMTAIGHEMDYTLADFVSDMRSPTPTASIEILLPTREEMYEKIRKANTFLTKILTEFLDKQRQMLNMMMELHEHMVENLYLTRIQQLDYASEKLNRCIVEKIRSAKETMPKIITPDAILNLTLEKMKTISERFNRIIMRKTTEESVKLKNLESIFEGFSYEKVLKRGFCLVTHGSDGVNVVQTAREARKIGQVALQFSDDKVIANIE